MAVIPVTLQDTLAYEVDIRFLVRPSLVGVILSSLLFGILVHQYIVYGLKTRFRGGNAITTALVVLIGVFSIIVFVTQMCYIFEMVVQDYGTPNPVANQHHAAFAASLGFNPCLSALSQAFFAHRAWKLHDRNLVIGGFLAVCIVGSTAAGIAQAVKMGVSFDDSASYPQVAREMRDVQEAHYLSAACLDAVICTLICVKLVQSKHDYRNSWTNTLLQRLLVLSMTTSGLTTIVAITAAVFAFVASDAGAGFVAVSLILPRCYAISVMFTLNLRDVIVDQASRKVDIEVPDLVTAQMPANRSDPLPQILEDQGIRVELEHVSKDSTLGSASTGEFSIGAYPSSGIRSA